MEAPQIVRVEQQLAPQDRLVGTGGLKPAAKAQKQEAQEQQVAKKAKPGDEERLAALEARLATMDVRVKISWDEATGDRIIKVIDRQTDEVVREVPAEEVRKLEASLDKLAGLLFDRQA